MKTNLEELNYRFRKELLNNNGYRCYFSLLHAVQAATQEDDFSYQAWVKGLFKASGKDNRSLAELVDVAFQDLMDVDCDAWDIEYERGSNPIDLINMPELVRWWVSLRWEQYNASELLWNIGLELATCQRGNDDYNKFVTKNCGIVEGDIGNVEVINTKMEKVNAKWAIEFVTSKLK